MLDERTPQKKELSHQEELEQERIYSKPLSFFERQLGRKEWQASETEEKADILVEQPGLFSKLFGRDTYEVKAEERTEVKERIEEAKPKEALDTNDTWRGSLDGREREYIFDPAELCETLQDSMQERETEAVKLVAKHTDDSIYMKNGVDLRTASAEEIAQALNMPEPEATEQYVEQVAKQVEIQLQTEEPKVELIQPIQPKRTSHGMLPALGILATLAATGAMGNALITQSNEDTAEDKPIYSIQQADTEEAKLLALLPPLESIRSLEPELVADSTVTQTAQPVIEAPVMIDNHKKTPAPKKVEPTVVGSGNDNHYQIKRGDTMYKIARAHGVGKTAKRRDSEIDQFLLWYTDKHPATLMGGSLQGKNINLINEGDFLVGFENAIDEFKSKKKSKDPEVEKHKGKKLPLMADITSLLDSITSIDDIKDFYRADTNAEQDLETRFNTDVKTAIALYNNMGQNEVLDTYAWLADRPEALETMLNYARRDLGVNVRTNTSLLSDGECEYVLATYLNSENNREALEDIRETLGMDVHDLYNIVDKAAERLGKGKVRKKPKNQMPKRKPEYRNSGPKKKKPSVPIRLATGKIYRQC